MSGGEYELKVFTDDEGRHGNPLGVVLDTAGWSDGRCQARAAELGHSETVFVDDAVAGRIRIFTPMVKFSFAGHPTVGTAWLLHRLGFAVSSLLTDAGVVPVIVAGDSASVIAPPEWSPPWTLLQLHSPAEVDALRPDGRPHDYVWAWLDEAAGVVRARAFSAAAGVVEDEATGSAAIRLAADRGWALAIRQGLGSWIDVAPGLDGVTLTGRVRVVR